MKNTRSLCLSLRLCASAVNFLFPPETVQMLKKEALIINAQVCKRCANSAQKNML
ncbi:MAG: hypothetical protein K0Q79_3314 [Flavipsychrobacter sp.]|jgi:hypothetical protein|nr:hypothetical protein [Flavipsychrobacter sp.]